MALIGNSDKEYKASILLIVSLFLPLLWNLIPYDLFLFFPFFAEDCDCFSIYPGRGNYREYRLQDGIPFYFAFVATPIFILCQRLMPDLVVYYKPIKIRGRVFQSVDLWKMHFIYYSIQGVDIFLAFSQIPYYRTFFVFVGIALHVKYLLDNR